MKRTSGGLLEYPDVLTGAYEAPDKSCGLILVNYLHDEKEILLDGPRKIWKNSSDESDFEISCKTVISPLSAVVVGCCE